MPKSAYRFCICLLCAIVVAASGCTVGPSLIRGSRTKYNSAVQRTASEEMLLNLVRARYGEPPEFLAVSGITSQVEIDGGISFGNEFGLGSGRWAGSLNGADRPTISLSPLQDEQFTRRFLSPIGLDTIYLFSRNGHRVERVLRLIVDQINGVRNTPDGLGSNGTPAAFVWLAQTLGELAKQQQVEFAYDETSEQVSPLLSAASIQGADVVAALEKGYRFQASGEDKSVVLTAKSKELVLRISPTAIGSPEVEGITELLRLKPGEAFYPLEPAVEGQLKPNLPPAGVFQRLPPTFQEELHVGTRSVEEILHFLCHGVLVPPKHIEAGLVGHQDELPVICPASPSDLLQVHWSRFPPHSAAVTLHYRGHWFYIDDADAASKETFELLLELYNLEIRGGGAASLPLLTLPIGR